MRLGTRLSPWLAVTMLMPPASSRAQWQGAIGLQERVYASALPGPGEARHEPVLVANARRRARFGDGSERVAASASLRAGPGDQGVLADLDELTLELVRARWTLRAGVSEVFWGVLESRHLVDVINQQAPDPGARGDLKLGQPMVNVAARGFWGTLDLYLLPWFRPRPFTGRAARLWSGQAVASGHAVFDAAAGVQHVDWAARGARAFGAWDVGLSWLAGTDREPGFASMSADAPNAALVPRYDLVRRVSLDVQWTHGLWLGKLEAVTSNPSPGRYVALGLGVEYAPADYVSAFVEFLYDGRASAATTSFEHDLCIGARLLHRDGDLGLRGSVDRVSGNATLGIETVRRLSNSLAVTLEATAFLGDPAREPPLARRLDTSVALGVHRYF